MISSRPGRIWGLIAEELAIRGGQVSAADACSAAAAAVDVTGAWLTTGSGPETSHLMSVTDGLGEQLAELELTTGEGPCPDAMASGGPVLASDLDEIATVRRWPVFTPAARQAGAAAIFAFPLHVGAIRTGVMGMYRDQRGPLSALQLGDALHLADAATLLLLNSQDRAGNSARVPTGADQPAELILRRAEIDQATGMLTEQLGVGIAEAFVRLRAYAYAHDARLNDVASDIVARRLRLRQDPDPDPDTDSQA